MRLSALTSSSSRRKAISRRPQRPGVVDTAGQPCRVRYAVLTDRMAARQSVEVCGGGNGSRERHVYLSTGNVVEISVDVRRDNPDYFVLLYEGMGGSGVFRNLKMGPMGVHFKCTFTKVFKIQHIFHIKYSYNFYRAMHFSANARSWDRMSSVRPSVCPSVCDVGDL